MLDVVTIACTTAGFLVLLYAFVALFVEHSAAEKLKKAADAIPLAQSVAATGIVSEVTKALKTLGEAAESFAKLPRSTAALVIAALLFALAVALVATEEIDDGVKTGEGEEGSVATTLLLSEDTEHLSFGRLRV